MPVAQAAATALEELHLLAVVGHFGDVIACLGVEYHGTAGHVDDDVFTVFAEGTAARTTLAVAGEDMAAVFEGQERPHVAVAAEDDMTAATAVAAVGTALGHVFGAVEMARAGAALARAAQYLDVVYEV